MGGELRRIFAGVENTSSQEKSKAALMKPDGVLNVALFLGVRTEDTLGSFLVESKSSGLDGDKRLRLWLLCGVFCEHITPEGVFIVLLDRKGVALY